MLKAILMGWFIMHASQPANANAPSTFEPDVPASTPITGITIDMATMVNTPPGGGGAAPGSDNWPMTWASNGHQYTSWGDGGGFGGDDTTGRVSWGFGRIQGDFNNFSGHNVNGGASPENAGTLPVGKSKGVLAIGTDLWMWRSGNGSDASGFALEHLYKSTDGGASWTLTSAQWESNWTQAIFIQFGQGNTAVPAALDGYAYVMAFEEQGDGWEVQTPGEIILMRCPEAELATKASWEFCTGTNPLTWGAEANRVPVLSDATDGFMRFSCTYNPVLNRYILIAQQVSRLAASGAKYGFFEAEFPWGPWTRFALIDPYNTDPNVINGNLGTITKTVFLCISPKWSFLAGNGLDLVLVGTIPGPDEFGAVAATLSIS